MELKFSGVKHDGMPVNPTQENVKAAAEKAKEEEERRRRKAEEEARSKSSSRSTTAAEPDRRYGDRRDRDHTPAVPTGPRAMRQTGRDRRDAEGREDGGSSSERGPDERQARAVATRRACVIAVTPIFTSLVPSISPI